jgi:cation:H+ antiporter
MNEILLPGLMIVGGLIVLVIGGEFLVRGASTLASVLRIPPLVIGLTVVAFGTSSPELVVSLRSAFTGNADIALGNVVGSNIFNVLFILGLSAMIVPLIVSEHLIRQDVPLMVAASVLLFFLSLDGQLARLDGLLLSIGLLAYIAWCIYRVRLERSEVGEQGTLDAAAGSVGNRAVLVQIFLCLLGLSLLAFGSKWLVEGSVLIARHLGVSELIIGLTIVAAGTSLPEAVTSVLAAWRGERDIAVGNIVGSNLFNILCVLGFSSLIAPHGLAISSDALRFDIPVMIAVALACLPIFFSGRLIARWEGALFFAYFAAYTTCMTLDAMDSEYHRSFTTAMLVFVLPLTMITLLITCFHRRTG